MLWAVFLWLLVNFFFSSRRRHTRYWRDWSSDVCSSDLFGGHGLWEATKAVIKTAALGTVVVVTSDRAQQLVSASGALPLSAVTATFTESAVLMIRVVAVTGLVIAVADYVIVRRQTMKQLKMSKYEIQQEHKNSEGDPHVKAQRRATQMAMSRNRMMAEVATA